MSLITDGILIAASLTACFYCLVLNFRLKALRNTETGIGATITQLTDSVGDLETSLAETKGAAALTAEKLEDLVGEAGTLADFLSDLLEKAETPQISLSDQPASPEAPPSEPAAEEGKEDELPTDIPLSLDYGDGEEPSAASDESDDDDSIISIDIDYDEDETLNAGTG